LVHSALILSQIGVESKRQVALAMELWIAANFVNPVFWKVAHSRVKPLSRKGWRIRNFSLRSSQREASS
jgi:type IV secretory pathway TrbD component